MAVDQHLDEGRDVAHAEIVALARDGMDAVGGIADQHQARVDVAVGMDEAERIPPARSGRLDVTEMIAEASGELGLEARRVELEQAAREIGALGPDDRRAMLAVPARPHRQDGEGAAGQEFLLGDAAVRPFVARDQHDRDLVVRPGARTDAGVLAHRAEAALGRGHQPRRRGAGRSSATRSAGPQSRLVSITSSGATSSTCGQVCQPSQQRGAQEAVLDDPAHRRRHRAASGRRLAMIEMEEERARPAVVAGVGNADVADRLGLAGDIVPDAERREQALAGVGDRRRAAVEAGLGQGRERHPVDQGRV